MPVPSSMMTWDSSFSAIDALGLARPVEYLVISAWIPRYCLKVARPPFGPSPALLWALARIVGRLASAVRRLGSSALVCGDSAPAAYVSPARNTATAASVFW